VKWATARLTLLRSPWNYIDAVDDFVAWVHAAGAVSQVWNPPQLVEWNVHKSYLLDLQARGAPVVSTVVLLQGTAASLDGICDARGWNAVVVKPAVGSSAKHSARFDVGNEAGQAHLDALLQSGDAIVQPFVRSVLTQGELSVMLVDGVVTHAVRKRPKARDYRVQEEWGGTSELVEPARSAAELAARVVEVLPAPALYARIDLLVEDDLWHVLEAEVTEPALWLNHAPASATDRLVTALVSRLE
jgi:glutathione synthase/RimK-type ligase-like ATP-grasp enzyme